MDYEILVLNNQTPFQSLQPVLDRTSKYFSDRTPLRLKFTIQNCNEELFLGNWGIKSHDGKDDLVGVLGIRGVLAALKVDGKKYNAIVFAYDLEKTYWFKHQIGSLRHWTHWEPYFGASIIEIATRTVWGMDDFYRVITHELLHASHQACRLNGYTTNDTLDLYDEENAVESPTGNRARNIRELSPYWDKVTAQPYLLGWLKLLQLQLLALKSTITVATIHKNVEKFAALIKQHEGWFEGSRSHRNNNPGNFRFSWSGYRDIYGNVWRDKDNFAIFPSYEKGWMYLCNFLQQACSGKSKTYSQKMTFYQFFAKYAPAEDNNNYRAYAEFVAGGLGVDPSATISSILS